MSDKKIPILTIDSSPRAMGLTDGKLSNVLQKTTSTVTSISSDVLRQNMSTVTHDFLEICDNMPVDTSLFRLDEIELALSIGGEGEVSILSAAAAKANVQASVVLKFKRNNNG